MLVGTSTMSISFEFFITYTSVGLFAQFSVAAGWGLKETLQPKQSVAIPMFFVLYLSFISLFAPQIAWK
jgi:hypothetical protein